MRAPCAISTALLLAACSTIGDAGGTPDGLPHGGTGEFRLLDGDELGIAGALPGRAMVLRDAIERAAPAGDFLFYATARLGEARPELPDGHPPGDIYWPAFEPRRIHRASAWEEGVGGFVAGPEVLAASEPWHGGEVYDPWPVILEDGTARLYYAAAGGVGLAEAPRVDGAFAHVAGPIVAGARRPSVIRGPDGAWWMYYEVAGTLQAARSEDGRVFDPRGRITIGGEDHGEGTEVERASPGAVRVETRAGRVLVRLYFESLRDGLVEGERAHVLYVAGSADGLAFERHPRAVLAASDARYPAPVLLDTRVTLLYASLPFFGGPYQTRAVVASVGPAGERFAPADADP